MMQILLILYILDNCDYQPKVGFPKVGKIGAMSSNLGAMSWKRSTEWPWGHNFKLTLDVLGTIMKSEKKSKVFLMLVWV